MTIVTDESIGQASASIELDRAARVPLKIPVLFQFADGRAKGQSMDISESGIFAVFDQRLEVWLAGQLTIVLGEWQVQIDACIARVDGRGAALVFRGMSDKNRSIVRNLIKDASAPVV